MTQEKWKIDKRKWRVGKHYDVHLYAEGNIPIATAMTPESAQQIVEEHNLMLELCSYVWERYSPREEKEQTIFIE